MTSCEIGLAEFERTFARHFTPGGTRLGVAVLHSAPPAVIETVEAAMKVNGLKPARRLARMQPRIGEDEVRPEDIVYFIERYGHEYVSVVLPQAMQSTSEEHQQLEEACKIAGNTLWCYAPPR